MYPYSLRDIHHGLEPDVRNELSITQRKNDNQLTLLNEPEQRAKIICRVEKGIHRDNLDDALEKILEFHRACSAEYPNNKNRVGDLLVDAFPEHIYTDWSLPNL